MTASIRYRNEIDGLRAIAVGSVILNHFDHALVPSGYLGVDIFFVISGYVITLSLCGREFPGLKDFLLGFYARRFKRLMPALILCVVVTALLTSLFNTEPAESLKTGLFALFGLSNLYLLRISNDYFGGLSQLNSFTHTWSLGVEEQFYLVFPFILWIALKNETPAKFRMLYAVIIAMAVLSLAVYAYFDTHHPMASFYLMPLRFWELAAGCLVAMVHTQRGRPERTRWRWPGNAILVLILGALFLPPSLALIANIAVVALTAAALAMLSPGSMAYTILTSKPAAYLGILSYSLYLWHWPVLVMSRFTIGLHSWSVPILVVLIFVVAHLSYHTVEKPLRNRSWAPTTGRTVLWGGAAACIAAGFVAFLIKPVDGRLYAGQRAQLAARTFASLTDVYRMPQTPYSWGGAKCVLASNDDAGKVIPLDACTLGRFASAPHRVMVLGNSDSAAFVHGFDALVRDDHYAVTITSAFGVQPVGGMPDDPTPQRSAAWYWDHVVPPMLSQLRPGDWVFLISDLARYAPQPTTPKATGELETFGNRLRDFSAQLAKTGVRLAVLDGDPYTRDAGCRPETALPHWFTPGAGPCTFFTKAETLARRQPVDALLRKLEREHRLTVIDAIDVFCPGQTCTFLGKDNHVLYRDEYSHPSVEAARDAAPLFRKVLTGDAAVK